MNHVELTIADLLAARNRADMLIQGLREFQAGCDLPAGAPGAPSAPPVIAPPENGSGSRVGEDRPAPVRIYQTETTKATQQRRPTGTVPQGTGKQAKRHRGIDQSERLLAVAAGLPVPFAPADLAAAAKVDKKTASNFIGNRVGEGMFVREGHGKYARGLKFPVGHRTNGTEKTETLAKQVAVQQHRPTNATAALTLPLRDLEVPMLTPYTKPTTLGAAMKMIILQADEFTGEQLRRALLSDKDYAKLLEQSPTGLCGNLVYWSNQGYLNKEGDGALQALFTVTKTGREWFSR